MERGKKRKLTVPSSVLHTCLVLQYNDLMKKKRIVENDKAKILQTIEELDQKKNEALNLAWQKVCSSCPPLWLFSTNL